jgi:hypothetical protein
MDSNPYVGHMPRRHGDSAPRLEADSHRRLRSEAVPGAAGRVPRLWEPGADPTTRALPGALSGP